jgi:hypothetical protein
LGENGGLKEVKRPEVGIKIFFKLPLHTFLRNKQLKFPRSFFKEPILIRVNDRFQGLCNIILTSVVASVQGVPHLVQVLNFPHQGLQGWGLSRSRFCIAAPLCVHDRPLCMPTML